VLRHLFGWLEGIFLNQARGVHVSSLPNQGHSFSLFFVNFKLQALKMKKMFCPLIVSTPQGYF
jgi:hypothetical protein